MTEDFVYLAKESFEEDGIRVKAGVTRLREGHPLLEKHRDRFDRLDMRIPEDETAEPQR